MKDAQAAAYRYAVNTSALDDRTTVESIAILLPAERTGTARSFLEHVAADCLEVELICPTARRFRTSNSPNLSVKIGREG
jgi:hypothetical protein